MNLIYTNDGLIGLRHDNNVTWVESIDQAIKVLMIHYMRTIPHAAPELREIERDVRYAIDYMAKTGDTVAEFGLFGSFMYTTTEAEYEFS